MQNRHVFATLYVLEYVPSFTNFKEIHSKYDLRKPLTPQPSSDITGSWKRYLVFEINNQR